MEPNMDWLNKKTTKNILLIAFVIILMGVAIFNFRALFAGLGKLISILFPFILGAAMAFIFNVPLRSIETRILKKDFKGKRAVSVLLTLILILAIIAAALLVIVPQMIDSISQLIVEIKGIASAFSVEAATQAIIHRFPWSERFIADKTIQFDYVGILNKITDFLTNMISDSGEGSMLSSLTGIIGTIVSGFATFLIGFAFSIYCLFRKESLSRQGRQIVYALFKEKTATRILEIGSMSNVTFQNFIRGQCLEACILGFMFLITMSIFRMPYALLVAVLITITALIPIFGAFIGCFISALLILIISPKQCLIFLIMFIVLQQIEGKLIYPHVVGGSVGLPSIWVLFAITVGGEIMGIAGMLIFVPLCSVLYALFRDFVVDKLKAKNVAYELYDIPYSERAGKELEAKVMVEKEDKLSDKKEQLKAKFLKK